MLDTLTRPLADAFLQVGVFVALMTAVFGVLQYRTGDRVTAFLAARWRSAPLVGALLGVTPGCGAEILMMPLYLRGTISFGTVIAALVATMGDSAFVLLAADPRLFLVVHAILLAAGIVCGYTVDALGIDPRSSPRLATPVLAGRSLGSAEAFAPRPAAPPPPGRLGLLPAAFWVLAGTGLLVALPVVVGQVDSSVLAASLGGIDPYLAVGALGTLVCLAVYVWPDKEEAGATSARAVLCQGARDTAFVTVWVAVAYVLTAVALSVLELDLNALLVTAGFGGVLLGAAVGLIPGCAVQVLLTGLYVSGVVPLATLLANAVSQDGDALFPLILLDRRSATVATVITAIPAVLVGTAGLAVLT